MQEQSERRLRIGVLIGGGGRTLLNLADHIERGELDAEIAAVIAPREGLRGVERARERGFDVLVTAGADDPDRAILDCLRETGAQLACLAGYMRHLRIPREYEGKVINIHPALLPSFGGKGMYGMRVHRAVIEHGCKVSGCTVHFVDDVYDNGPILVQKCCEVREDDTPETLAARVFDLECQAYPEAIGLIAAGRVSVEGRRVRVARGSSGLPPRCS